MAEYLIQEETLTEMADAVRSKVGWRDQIAKYVTARDELVSLEFPKGVASIRSGPFQGCDNLTTITFNGTPTYINSTAFYGCHNLTTINVPWSEGEVAYAPWGAKNATINYNYTGG